MQWRTLFLTGAAMAGFAIMPLGPAYGDHGAAPNALEQQCRAAERTAPDACPCIIAAGQQLGFSDDQIAAVLMDRATEEIIEPADRGRIRRARFECIREAMQARFMQELETRRQNPAPDGTYTARPNRPQPQPSDQYIGQAPNRAADQGEPEGDRTEDADENHSDSGPCSSATGCR